MKQNIPIPIDSSSSVSQFEAYIEIVKLLRQFCPWDKEQTHRSISHLLIEEAFETYQAIQDNDSDGIKEELGDLLLHIVMNGIIGEEENTFTLAEIISYSAEKMVHRHPHIFAGLTVSDTAQVLQNWERLKNVDGKKSVLAGVPIALPALIKAERIQQKAAKVGFEWDNRSDMWNKVLEEVNELKQALESNNFENIEEEFGDVLFSIVNAARYYDVVSENALHKTNEKFIKRFGYVEQTASKLRKDMNHMTLQEMDELWNEAKKNDNVF